MASAHAQRRATVDLLHSFSRAVNMASIIMAASGLVRHSRCHFETMDDLAKVFDIRCRSCVEVCERRAVEGNDGLEATSFRTGSGMSTIL